MKRTLYLLTLAVAVIGGIAGYSNHVASVERDAARARFETGMERMKLENKCLEMKGLLIQRGDSARRIQSELERQGFTYFCEVK